MATPRRWLGVALGLLGALAGCDNFLNSQVFYPSTSMDAHPSELGWEYEELTFSAPGGPRLHGWWLPHEAPEGVLVFCHGNAGNISHRLEMAAILKKAGLSVLLFDYRGYGKSQGEPDEPGCKADSEAAYEIARSKAGGLPVIVLGRSLGGAFAAHLAAEKNPDGVILECTFSSLLDIARTIYPVGWFKDLFAGRLETAEMISRYHGPVLVTHGSEDDVAPIELGRKVYEAANRPKDFYEIIGAGHGDTMQADTPEYVHRLEKLIQAAGRR